MQTRILGYAVLFCFWLVQAAGAFTVFGRYERVSVPDTSDFPFSSVGTVGDICTGTLISKRHVLTAGHCVYDKGKFARDLSFVPGQNGRKLPYGRIAWTRVLAPTNYTRLKSTNYDYAVVVLEEDIGEKTGFIPVSQTSLSGYTINILGYPGDKAWGTQWRVSCPVEFETGGIGYYFCDSKGGMSGSAIYGRNEERDNKVQRTIYGVHTSSGEVYNSGVVFTREQLEQIQAWVRTYR